MRRRKLLIASGAALIGPVGFIGCAAPVVKPGTEKSADAADIALSNRVTWGVTSASLNDMNRLSRRDYLQGQLRPDADGKLPAPVQSQIDALGAAQKPMLAWVAETEQQRRDAQAITDDDAKKAAQQAYQQAMNRLARDASTCMLLRALYSPQQLQEQLAWFWFNHFNVHQHKRDLRAMVGDYQDRLRAHALGKFRDLLIASATHPAMIRYLDNEQNAAGRINENFAREVMELHTLGIDGGYSQKDVQELARVLTGLGVNFNDKTPNVRAALQPLYRRDGATEFNPARHDSGEKLVLGVRVPAGGGWSEVIDQLTRLARHPATARHVSRKLAVYFVADEPPPALVDRMARAFDHSDGDIAVTLQAMFDAPDFSPSLARKFKDPVHFVVSAVRLAYDGRQIVNAAPMFGWINRLGEGLYNRQTPDGYPLTEAAWSSSGQMSTRFEIARTIGSGRAGLFSVEGAGVVDVPAFAQLSNSPVSNTTYHTALAPTLGARTRAALDGAASPREWNALLLASPEFMYR